MSSQQAVRYLLCIGLTINLRKEGKLFIHIGILERGKHPFPKQVRAIHHNLLIGMIATVTYKTTEMLFHSANIFKCKAMRHSSQMHRPLFFNETFPIINDLMNWETVNASPFLYQLARDAKEHMFAGKHHGFGRIADHFFQCDDMDNRSAGDATCPPTVSSSGCWLNTSLHLQNDSPGNDSIFLN